MIYDLDSLFSYATQICYANMPIAKNSGNYSWGDKQNLNCYVLVSSINIYWPIKKFSRPLQ